jgi:hypothetical protein
MLRLTALRLINVSSLDLDRYGEAHPARKLQHS